MDEKLSFSVEENYLSIKASGVRDDFMEIIEGTTKIAEASKRYNKQHILSDYRDVVFDLPLTQAFNLVKVYENKLPYFHRLHMASVVQSSQLEIASFYASICKKRGFNFEIFMAIEEAETWLINQPVNK